MSPKWGSTFSVHVVVTLAGTKLVSRILQTAKRFFRNKFIKSVGNKHRAGEARTYFYIQLNTQVRRPYNPTLATQTDWILYNLKFSSRLANAATAVTTWISVQRACTCILRDGRGISALCRNPVALSQIKQIGEKKKEFFMWSYWKYF